MIVIKVRARHGLKKSHAVAITRTERAMPITREKRRDASEAIDPSKKPMKGTHLRMTISGVNTIQSPVTQSTVPRKRNIWVDQNTAFS